MKIIQNISNIKLYLHLDRLLVRIVIFRPYSENPAVWLNDLAYIQICHNVFAET